MTELPDDELDKLFRKSSEELDPYFEPEDWNDLKKRLDAEDGVRSGGWLRKWWPSGILLLLFLGGVVTYFAMDKKATIQPVVPVTVPAGLKEEGKAVSEKVVEKKSQGGNETISKKENTTPVSNAGEPALTKSNNGKILPLNRSEAGGVFLEPNRSRGRVGEGAFSSNVQKELRARTKAGKSVVTATSETEKKNVSHALAPEKKEAYQENAVVADGSQALVNEVSALKVGLMKHLPINFNTHLRLPVVVVGEVKEVAAEEIKHAEASPPLAVRFGYAPDLSTVGFKGFSKPGAAVSLIAEYQIIKRLYVQSGVIWSNKVYGADSADYIIAKRDHYYGPKAKAVDGVCKVFELPVNLRYDIFQGENSRWFAGAGVSSYHMNSETYSYRFDNPQDPRITDKDRGWRGSTGWWWLSHLNASAGYEYRISKKLSLMAEPYLRLPLKRVGYGNVKLVTTGVWLSVRYTPFLK